MIQVPSKPNYKRIALFTAVALGTIAVLLIAWRFIDILALLVVSLAVAAMVRTPVKWLTARRVPMGLATIIIYLIGIAVIVGIGWFVVPHVATEIQRLAQDMMGQYESFHQRITAGQSFERLLARRLPAPSALNDLALGGALSMQSSMMTLVGGLFGAIAQSLLVIVISIYWSADSVRFERLWLSLLTPELRMRARATWRQIDSGLGAYIRSEVAQCLLAGALLTPIFFLLGLPYPVTIALFISLAWLLPLVGGALALLPVLLMVFLVPLPIVVAAVVATIIVLWLLEFKVERRLYARERYGSVLVLLITIAIVEALGLVGLIIAPPLATAVQIAINEWLRAKADAPVQSVLARANVEPLSANATIPRSRIETLRGRLQEAQQSLEQLGTQSPRTAYLLERLNKLVGDTEKEALES